MSRYLPVSIAMTSRTKKGQLPLPPYGRQVLARLERDEHPNIWLFGGGRAWEEARWHNQYIGRGTAMLLPLNEDPYYYYWPVKGLTLMLVWLDDLRQEVTWYQITKFGRALVRDGAVLVVAPFVQDPEGFLFFRPENRPHGGLSISNFKEALFSKLLPRIEGELCKTQKETGGRSRRW